MNNPAKFLGDSFGTTLLIFMLMLTSNRGSARNQLASPEELFRQAQAASREKDYVRAEKLYRQVLATDPQVLAARVNLGLAYHAAGDYSLAASELEGVVREAVRASGRQVTAMIGPYRQAVAACAAIGRSPLSLERDLLFGGAGMPELAMWVGHLHERIDGRGYPDGLGGDEIPIESRILHVADALETMTSPRLYRSPLSAAAALEELERHAGSQFDAAAVRVMCDLVRSGAVEVGEQPRLGVPLGETATEWS